MAYLSLYRKYRPQTFGEILGQEHVSETLANEVNSRRISHAYLFTGPRGTGKTSTARILAKALNCINGPTSEPCQVCEACIAITNGSSLDVFEMDAASHSGVDDTREILAGVSLATAGGRKKVYVIDEVHMLTTQSFNTLLKTLEEPPEHVVFVLATTEAHKVLPTIVSRTQRFDFRRISAEVLEAHLSNVAKLEDIDVEQEALAFLARHADGSARDALSALDQLASFEGKVTVERAEGLLGRRAEDTFFEVFDAIASGDVGAVFRSIQSFVAQGRDLRQLAFDALEHTRSLLLLKSAPDAEGLLDVAPEDRPRLLTQAEAFSGAGLLRTLDLLGKAIIEMRNAPNHRLLLEVALVRAAAPETDPSATGLLGRIERLERRIGIATGDDAPAAAEVPATQPKPVPAPSAESATPAPKRKTAAARRAPAPRTEAPVPPVGAVPEPAPAIALDGSVGFGHVRDAWSAALKEVNKTSRRIGALLNPSRPVSLDGDRLVVEVQSDWHATEMSQIPNKEVVAGAIHDALGIRPQLAFVERGKEAAPVEPGSPIDGETAAVLEDAEPIEGGEHDPLELVKKGLGAEVVEERGSR